MSRERDTTNNGDTSVVNDDRTADNTNNGGDDRRGGGRREAKSGNNAPVGGLFVGKINQKMRRQVLEDTFRKFGNHTLHTSVPYHTIYIHPSIHPLSFFFYELVCAGTLTRCDIRQSFAFFTYTDMRDAEDAMNKLNGAEIEGGR
jgi:RNA recognition motif-containing protein